MNLHMVHLEDLIFTYGLNGLDLSYSLLANRSYYSPTIKYDGAPSVFVGIDKADGKYFVSTKSIANVTPILYKSLDDIPDTPLGKKLKVVFEECKCLGITKGVIQGDIMWTDDVIYDGNVSTFQANTLIYETHEDLSKYKLGITFHTLYLDGFNYTGCNTDTWQYDNPNLKLISNVAVNQDSNYYYNELSEILEDIESIKCMNLDFNNEFLIGYCKSYMNHVIKNNDNLKFDEYFLNKMFYKIGSLKSHAGKLKWVNLLDTNLELANRFNVVFDTLFKISELKNTIVNNLDQQNRQFSVYLEKIDGNFLEVGHEGYVLETNNTFVKLVNREIFSRANFSDDYKKAFKR